MSDEVRFRSPLTVSVRLRAFSRGATAKACMCLLLSVSTTSLGAQNSTLSEYQWKANFLAKSANFVDWPGNSPLRDASAFRWCVYGNFSFGTSLAELTRDMAIEGKKSEVKWIRKEAELAGCQIIFISRSEAKHYAKLLEAARPGRGLTVGETEDFLEAGGMVTLLTEGKTPAFEVNLDAVEAARMKLSSRLLVLARKVVNHATVAKG